MVEGGKAVIFKNLIIALSKLGIILLIFCQLFENSLIVVFKLFSIQFISALRLFGRQKLGKGSDIEEQEEDTIIFEINKESIHYDNEKELDNYITFHTNKIIVGKYLGYVKLAVLCFGLLILCLEFANHYGKN